MSKIIYAIKIADLSFSGLKVLHVKIGQTSNIKRTLAQYRRGNPGVEILDLWEPNLLKTVSESEKGIHEIAKKYAYEREGEKFIFLQESYKEFAENVNLLLSNVPESEVGRKTKTRAKKGGNYTGKKPESIKLQDKPYEVNSWREVLGTVAEQIYEDRKDFTPALKIKGGKRVYFSKNAGDLRTPKKVKGTPYFFEGNINANLTMRIVDQLLEIFGYDKSDLEIIYR
ncbi:unnamed protein product [marine sediment metagenome]|uniref:Replication modulator SeqA C-terminal DNA-binding domain-containing protein n=1 Tax=marine sediment metagenome TaxID=412755 RepID=X0ZMU2_9ZZZZ